MEMLTDAALISGVTSKRTTRIYSMPADYGLELFEGLERLRFGPDCNELHSVDAADEEGRPCGISAAIPTGGVGVLAAIIIRHGQAMRSAAGKIDVGDIASSLPNGPITRADHSIRSSGVAPMATDQINGRRTRLRRLDGGL